MNAGRKNMNRDERDQLRMRCADLSNQLSEILLKLDETDEAALIIAEKLVTLLNQLCHDFSPPR